MVTCRLRPLLVEGAIMHQIGIPFHWAFAGEVVGDNANDLTALLADPNVSMHEAKAFACQVYAGRSGGPFPRATKPPAPWPTLELVPDTPAAAQPEGKFHDGKGAGDVVPRGGRKPGDAVSTRAGGRSNGGKPR
jgi:formate dehydrogenase major subunit